MHGLVTAHTPGETNFLRSDAHTPSIIGNKREPHSRHVLSLSEYDFPYKKKTARILG